MKKFMIAALFGLMACNSEPTHSGKVKHGYDLTNKDVIRGEIVVDLKDDVSDSDVEELSKMVGVRLHAGNPTANKYKIEHGRLRSDTPDMDLTEEGILDQLNADPRVEHAEPMVQVHALYVPNDPMYEEQWGLTRVGAENAWGKSCGMGVKIAVVDTGISSKMSDLDGSRFAEGYNFIGNNTNTEDDQGHGSHCAGSVAQATNNNHGGAGMSFCATLLPVKVLSSSGSGTMEGVAEGIRFAADHGAQVISLSLGSDHPSDVVEDAVNYAHDKGAIVIAAAGNSGGSVGYPAAYENAVAVSALAPRDEIADFSSRGPEVAISSPGVDILQQTICQKEEGCFKKFSGTSMATPIVSGAAGMVIASGITDPDAVKAKLQNTADSMDDPELFGAGILRADSAVQSTIFSHTMWRLISLVGILFFLRKKINMAAVKSKLSMLGIVGTAFGAVPLFFTGLLPRMGSLRILGELVARPMLEWSNVLGFTTKYLPLGYAVPAIAASLLLLNTKMKSLAGGLALGTAAFCLQVAYNNDITFFLGGMMLRATMIGSAIISLYFVKTIFEKKV